MGWAGFPVKAEEVLVLVCVSVVAPVSSEAVLAVVHLWAGHGGSPLHDVDYSLERHLEAPAMRLNNITFE